MCVIPCIYSQNLEEHVEKRRVQLKLLEKWWSAGEEEGDSDINLLSATLELQANEMCVPSMAMMIILL